MKIVTEDTFWRNRMVMRAPPLAYSPQIAYGRGDCRYDMNRAPDLYLRTLWLAQGQIVGVDWPGPGWAGFTRYPYQSIARRKLGGKKPAHLGSINGTTFFGLLGRFLLGERPSNPEGAESGIMVGRTAPSRRPSWFPGILGHDPAINHRAGLHWKRAPGTIVSETLIQVQQGFEVALDLGHQPVPVTP